jgi:hypothetical protein
MVSPVYGDYRRCQAEIPLSDLFKFAEPALYIVALKNQGYDFTVAAKVSGPSHCLERTDAANGSFYTDCQKQ